MDSCMHMPYGNAQLRVCVLEEFSFLRPLAPAVSYQCKTLSPNIGLHCGWKTIITDR